MREVFVAPRKPQWNNPRGVKERIFIEGDLALETPASFSSGDVESMTDIPILRDSIEPHIPLLTGASIAGALRNYLRERELGYAWQEDPKSAIRSSAELLFGYLDDTDEGHRKTFQSWLAIDDARGVLPPGGGYEWRDGVAIDPKTHTAAEGKKFDYELIAAGTTFTLHFEYWRTDKGADMLGAFVSALQGFERGEIRLGLRKRRGFGQCRVTNWRVWRYPMDSLDGVFGWLHYFRHKREGKTCSQIAQAFPDVTLLHDNRQHAELHAEFVVDGSLLIRSDTFGTADVAHLHSFRNGAMQPILSGTSLAGALRARALRIANTILGEQTGAELVNRMFGRRIESNDDQPEGSWLTVDETVITGRPITDRIQQRVKIDRFTGGAYPQALFAEQPLFSSGSDPARATMRAILRQPVGDTGDSFKAQVGLLLLLLKDLWTGDLPIGGERSVGRGRLRGERATLRYRSQTWTIERDGNTLQINGDRQALEDYVTAFVRYRQVQ